MATISQTTFSNAFRELKLSNCDACVTDVCSYGSHEQYFSIGSNNDLVPSRRQAIIWTNDG